MKRSGRASRSEEEWTRRGGRFKGEVGTGSVGKVSAGVRGVGGGSRGQPPGTKAAGAAGLWISACELGGLEEEPAVGGQALEQWDGGWEEERVGALPRSRSRVLLEPGGGAGRRGARGARLGVGWG